jgi:hypothetical protein
VLLTATGCLEDYSWIGKAIDLQQCCYYDYEWKYWQSDLLFTVGLSGLHSAAADVLLILILSLHSAAGITEVAV